jgi:hypothetical protein
MFFVLLLNGIRDKVDKAARKVIKDVLDIEFNEYATKYTKRVY